MPTDANQWLQLVFSVTVIVLFGYRQFNAWTSAEVSGEIEGTEIFSFAPPRSFTTMLWKFVAAASFYCLALVVFYVVLVALLSSAPASALKFLSLDGVVTKENAWLVALFVVTGLSPMLPVIDKIERTLREELHEWAFIPRKAQEMALELTLPTAQIHFDERHFKGDLGHKLLSSGHFHRADFVKVGPLTVAEKWCRLMYLFHRFQPAVKVGRLAAKLNSPYVFQVDNDFRALEREVTSFAKDSPDLLRAQNDGRCSELLSRIDALQERLYLLMCCLAFATSRTDDRAVKQFEAQYGLRVERAQCAAPPVNPMLDALMVMTVVVLVICVAFTVVFPDTTVQPLYWTISACLTHGAGLLIGWLVFSHHRHAAPKRENILVEPVSRKLLLACVVLAFVLATVPTFGVTFSNVLLHPLPVRAGEAPPSVLEAALSALQRSWPWAFLGSATAFSTYLHLERSVDVPVTTRTCLRSGVLQATGNCALSLLIMAVHTPTRNGGAPDLLTNLQSPVLRLVLALTATIGLVIGFFLPLVVRGYGRDRRVGLQRFAVPEGRMEATLTHNGHQTSVALREMSLSGSVLEVRDASVTLDPGCHAVLTLCDGTALRILIVRSMLKPNDPQAVEGVRHFAVSHMQNRGPTATLTSAMAQKLGGFLQPQAGVATQRWPARRDSNPRPAA